MKEKLAPNISNLSGNEDIKNRRDNINKLEPGKIFSLADGHKFKIIRKEGVRRDVWQVVEILAEKESEPFVVDFRKEFKQLQGIKIES